MRAGPAVVAALAVWAAEAVAPAQAGPQQAAVQVALRALGLYDGAVDGVTGPETRAALEAAQRRAHLPQTGVLDRRTRLSLGPLGRPLFGARVLVRGDFGLDVSTLQFMLERRALYHGALDGYYDRLTATAVESFQRRDGLTVDGVVGARTAAALLRRLPAARAHARVYVVQPGDSLTAISKRFGVTLGKLAHANRLDPSHVLLIGTRLVIPATPEQSPAKAAVVRARLDFWARRLGVSSSLVRALAWMESGYQPGLVSSAGARGVLQLLPSTRQYVQTVLVGHPLPRTLDGDVEAGVLLIRHLLAEFGGDQRLALAAWYQGAAAVRQRGLYAVTKPFVADVLALEARM